MTLILASTSNIRRQLLTNAGVIFDVRPPDVDEAGIKIRHRACSAEDLAMKLGTNYPFGPFEWGQKIGLRHICALLDAVHQDTADDRYKICPLLRSEMRLASGSI